MFTTVLTWAVFLQAVTAGRILTGDEMGATSTAPPPACCSSWRWGAASSPSSACVTVPVAGSSAWCSSPSASACSCQPRLGTAAADGEDTLWIHVPLGVALVGLLAHATHVARRVGSLA